MATKVEDKELNVKVEDKELNVKVEDKELSVKVEDKELSVKVEDKELSVKVEDKELNVKVEDKELNVKVEDKELNVKVEDKELNVKLLNAIKAELTCEICHEPIVNAMLFENCGHIFCEYCILQQSKCPHGAYSCPKCRTHSHGTFLKSKFIDKLVKLVFENEYEQASLQKIKDQYRKELTNQIKKQLEEQHRQEQAQVQQIIPDNTQYNYIMYQDPWYHRLFTYNNTMITSATILTACTVVITIKFYKNFN